MSAWIVYSKDGKTQRCELKRLEYSGSHMGERAVTATFEHYSEVAFDVFDHIVYRGEKFELESIPSVKKISRNEYEYELRFVSLKYELERCEMRDIVPNDNGVVYPTPLTFSFTGDVRYLVDRIQANLDALYGKGVWNIVVSEGVSSDEKNISIAQQNCWNALSLVNTTYGLNFSVRGREVVIGGEIDAVSHTFQYGKGNGLYEIERASDTDTGIVTKLRAYGSTKNLDYSYPKKPEWADSVLPVSFALSPLRLMLPSFKEDGKTDYVLADDAVIAKYGIREASIVYDDIYPSIAGAKNSSGQAIDEIASVDAVNEESSTFTVYLHDLGFDLEEHLTTAEAQLSMKTGTLQGYTFNISAIDRQGNGGYKLTLGRNSVEGSEESGFNVPNKDWNMKAGDKFVLLNILMPQAYIREAEQRLLSRANEYLAEYGKTNFSYNVGLHDKFLVEHPSIYDSLVEGVKLRVQDNELGISEDVIIQSITITEYSDDNILPQVKVTLNNKPSASTLDRIQGKLNDVIAETSANSFSSQNELMAQYRKKLDKPFFDKLFVAIDKDGNEIASNDVATPVSYIKAKYSIATVGGVTMYAEDDVEVPTLAEGLPFDQRTIWFNPETKQIEVIGGTGGGGEGGVSNFWDLSGIPSWITNAKPSYNYSEIKNTPDLSVFVTGTALSNTLADYATLSYLTGELKKYVTLDGAQDITGVKNFLNGIKISNMPIRKLQDDVIYIDANLVVRGGVTMYADGGSLNIPSIYDGLPIDGVTLVWEETADGKVLKINPNIELGGGLDEGELNAYLTNNNYAKKSDITAALSGYAPASALNAVSTKLNDFLEGSDTDTVINKWKELETFLSGLSESDNLATILSTKWTTDNNLINQWNTAYGWGDHSKVGYALKSYVDNNFVTIGTKQTITGEKNFTGGLKVNGSPIYYDATNKYWKLEGDLLVTGGVTMYGTDNEFEPSSIMDALLYDKSTLGINENGELYVKGGGSVSGDYLPLSGGKLTSASIPLTINRDANNSSSILFQVQGSSVGILGFNQQGILQVRPQYDSNTSYYDVWHAGNLTPSDYLLKSSYTASDILTKLKTVDGYGSGLAADILGARDYNGGSETSTLTTSIKLYEASRSDDTQIRGIYDNGWHLYLRNVYIHDGTNSRTILHSGNIANYNAGSATKLQTARTIWGQSFDGTGNINGTLYLNNNVSISGYVNNVAYDIFRINENNHLLVGYGHAPDGNTSIYGNNVYLRNGADRGYALTALANGNVGIGTINPSYKLHVDGNGYFSSTVYFGNSTSYYLGNAGSVVCKNLTASGTASITDSLTVNGKIKLGGTDAATALLEFSRDGYNYITFPNTLSIGTSTAAENRQLIINSTSATFQCDILPSAHVTYSLGTYGNCFKNSHINVVYSGDATNNLWLVGGNSANTYGVVIGRNGTAATSGAEICRFNANGMVWASGVYGDIRTTDTNIYLRRAGDNANTVLLANGYFSPYSTATDLLMLGRPSARWKGVYLGGLTTTTLNSGGVVFCDTSNYGLGVVSATSNGRIGIGACTEIYFRVGCTKGADGTITNSSTGAVLDKSANLLVSGGITMYSDKRKKTILNHVELSLKQIAEAPLIEHYYNSDQDKTTHVGSIAQYWAGLNDWFCKLDNEGFYTMEIQNCALASAISIARHLERYESKTDKTIRKMKKRIQELEDEVERLKIN